MHKLCNVLKASKCRWKKLTATEVRAHDNKIEVWCAMGKVISKPRKKWSDAGVKYKQVANDGEENEGLKLKKQKKGGLSKQHPVKKATSKKLQVLTSCEYITDSDDFNKDCLSNCEESDG